MLFTWLAFLAVTSFSKGEDRLGEALTAIRKRSQSLAPPQVFYGHPYFYETGQPEDIGYGYQKSGPENGAFEPVALPYSELGLDLDGRNNALEKLLLDYIEESHERGSPRSRPSMSRKRSVFRERDDSDYEDEEPMPKSSSPFRERGKSHQRQSLRGPDPMGDDEEREQEEYLAALNSIWEKYRGDDADPEDISNSDVAEILDYLTSKEEKKRQMTDGYDFSPLAWYKKSGLHHKRYSDEPVLGLFDARYPYRSVKKRFPVTKRSPAYSPMTATMKKKRSNNDEKTLNKKTDEKTAADLSAIFSQTNGTVTPATTTTPSGQKEQSNSIAHSNKPLEIKKKSINWSDYFGLDRKKKSSDRLEYMKSNKSPEDIDSKMKDMEDLIVDEAIKYTGAHEGSRNIKEIQEVKERVLAQLAAAYSLEKMRRALGEFKASIAAQKVSAPHLVTTPSAVGEHRAKTESKKSVTPNGKETKKHTKQEPTNEFKTRGNRPEYVEDGCLAMEELDFRCRRVSYVVGDRSGVFLPFCSFHQLCDICGSDRMSLAYDCDAAFASKAAMVCGDDPTCALTAKRFLLTLRSIPRSNVSCDWRINPCLGRLLPSVASGR